MESYAELRRQEYGTDLIGKYAQFIEHIHDIVRSGELERLSAPLSVYWAITGRCNLKCEHCYASELHKSSNGEINIEKAKRIVDLLYHLNIAELVIEGGEPTLYAEFNELLRYIKGKGISVTILSNGTCMTDGIIECINVYLDDLDIVQVSIDGNRNSCNAIRGEGVYEKVIGSIKKLKKQVKVNCVVTADNIDSIPELCEILFAIPNIRTFHLSPVMKIGRGKTQKSPAFEKAQALLKNLKEIYGNWVSGSAIQDSLILSKQNYFQNKSKSIKLGCCAGRSKMYINEEGKVFSCEFLQDKKGISLFEEEFEMIWTNNWNEQAKDAKKISLEMKEKRKFIPFCADMEMWDEKRNKARCE